MQKIAFLLICLILSASNCMAQKSIAIFGFKSPYLNTWGPEDVKSGVPGSEEAIIYMSEQLALLGYKVVVFANPHKGSSYSLPDANPRFVDADFNDGKKFDIGIIWRIPQLAKQISTRVNKLYFWPHDICGTQLNGPPGISSTLLSDDQFDYFSDVLWLSQWQRQQWIAVNGKWSKYDKIFGNGVQSDSARVIKERVNPYSCIYGSNYARGLEILLCIWPQVKASFPKATLDIYYGWQHWGNLSPEKEACMRSLVSKLEPLGVKDHECVGHEELTKAYEQASLWTYPCIAPETFCITALRAQYAGAVPVVLDGTALRETVQHGYKCNRPEDYLELLLMAMKDADKITLVQREKMGDFIEKEYTWKAIAKKWSLLFE